MVTFTIAIAPAAELSIVWVVLHELTHDRRILERQITKFHQGKLDEQE